MSDDLEAIRGEAGQIAASLRELLLWEETLGGGGPALSKELPMAAREVPSKAETSSMDVAPGKQEHPAPPADRSPAVAPPPVENAARSASPGGDRAAQLRVLAEQAEACQACELHRGRQKSVFSRGSAHAELVFVGEGPGANEDRTGRPFVGRAGQLLDRMVAAMGMREDEIYICNVVKCRPPQNRTPSPVEAGRCLPFLSQQIQIVQPKVIVALGRCAAENLGVAGERGWRGRWGTWEGVPVMPTYHPAYLLRSPEQKKPVWQDLKKVVARLGRTLPIR